MTKRHVEKDTVMSHLNDVIIVKYGVSKIGPCTWIIKYYIMYFIRIEFIFSNSEAETELKIILFRSYEI